MLDYRDPVWASFDIQPILVPLVVVGNKYPNGNPPPVDPPVPPSVPAGIIEPRVALAIMDVEANGQGFGSDGRMLIRFEAHIFRQLLANEARFREHFRVADERAWAEPQYYRDGAGDWLPIHTGDQRDEWAAYEVADLIDPEAAAKSISMGVAQIMGFNHARVGYPSARAMAQDYDASEAAQVLGFLNYVLSDAELVRAVRAKDWRTIARLYNGSGNVDLYSGRLQAAYEARA